MPNRKTVTAPLPFDFAERSADEASRLILLLHGFAETGSGFLKKLAPVLPDGITLIAPNGPFPMPYKSEERTHLNYSWYFHDPATQEYEVDMQTSIQFLAHGLKELGHENSEKIVIGFSQGGYLAPIAALEMKNVKQVIGIGAEYLLDEFPSHKVPFRIDGIHGKLDRRVPYAEGEASFRRLGEAGIDGKWMSIESEGHSIGPDTLRVLSQLVVF